MHIYMHVISDCKLPINIYTDSNQKCFLSSRIPVNTKHLHITFIQCCTNVEDGGPTLYKCYANALCLLGCLSYLSSLWLLNLLSSIWAGH